jgi:putative transcriptional regulator
MKISIKEQLTKINMSRYKFEQLSGLSRGAVTGLYKGENSRITLDVLEKICVILNCTPNDIIIDDENDDKNKEE